MQIEQVKLKNNLSVLFIHSPGSTSGTCQIWFRAGSALEGKDNQGIAHFLEHMFFKGTPTRPGSKIAHEVESYGGEINAFTSFDYTCYYINTPANHILNSTEILMDMVSHPQFLESELIPERDVVFEEYRRSLDNPSQFNFKQMQEQSFQNGYAHPILGQEETIKNFSVKQLSDFRKKYYNLNNAMLIVAGDLKNREELEKLIEKFKMPEGSTSEFPEFTLKNSNTCSSHHKEVKQVVISMAIPAPHYTSDEAPAEDLAMNCLGHGETSRLFKRLITKSPIASGVSASTMFFSKGGCHFARIALPEKNINKALSEFLSEFQNVLNSKFNQEEITKIKNQYVASKVFERESIESFAFSLGHGFAQNGDIHCEAELIKKIKATPLSEVNKSLINIFKRQIHITAQLPKEFKTKNIDKTLKEFVTKLQKMASDADKKLKNNDLVIHSNFDPSVKVIQITKGVKFVYRQNLMTPTFVFHSYIKGGQAYETSKNAGLYQLMTRTLTYGYKGCSYDELREDLDTKSAYLNGYSGKNAFGLTLHGLSEHTNELLKHYFGIFNTPEFNKKFVKLEKELIFRAIDNQKEDPVKQCFKAFNQYVFRNHPYALDIHGTKDSIKSMNEKNLERTFKDSVNKTEIIFTYCGDKNFDEIYNTVKKYCAHLKPRLNSKKSKNKIKPMYGQKQIIQMPREQTHLMIGIPSYKNGTDEDLYLKMLTTHLSGQSSELFVEVRDRQGLCYSVQPVHHSALEAGYWGIYIGAGHDKKDKAKEAILNLINKIKDNGFTVEEFDRIKKMIDGQNQVNIQTNDDYANLYSIPLLHSMGLDFQHESFAKIRNFNLKDFNNFLKSFLSRDWNIVEVGP
jgi:zinc protease